MSLRPVLELLVLLIRSAVGVTNGQEREELPSIQVVRVLCERVFLLVGVFLSRKEPNAFF